MTTPRGWRLDELTFRDLRDRPIEVALLPFGATEPHNFHLPYGTDSFEADALATEACGLSHARGASVVQLPVIPYGTETNMRELPFAMNLDPSTVLLVVRDLVSSLAQSGVRKVVLLNMHGGNALKPVLRELYGKVDAHLFLCNWWELAGADMKTIFDVAEDHAGEVETSFALARFEHLVRHREDGGLDADTGAVRSSRFEAVEKGWVTLTRPWHLLTDSTGAADPHGATRQKGERLLEILSERLASFIVELSGATIDDHFPFVAGPRA